MEKSFTPKMTPAAQMQFRVGFLSRTIPLFHWGLFLVLVLLTFSPAGRVREFALISDSLLAVKPFTLLIGITVALLGAIISQYAKNYLKGFRFQERFMGLTLGFTLSVLVLVASESLIILILAWMSMGFHMSRLIGIDSRWPEAKEAGRVSGTYFIASSILLSLAIGIPAFQTGSLTLSGLLKNVDRLPNTVQLLSAILLITSAVIQSALFPFHRWLLSSMTAPTPASGLMHAGFVNGAGVLLALFAPLILTSQTLPILVVLGGSTAIIAQFSKLIQVQAKHKLACSTIAQMGFMVFQCGLGFFNAAVTHLILHGLYKAYLFLSAGEGMTQGHPSRTPHIHITLIQGVVVGIYGVGGALLFGLLTGKGNSMDSGLFLSMIVALSVGQLTYNVVKQKSLARLQRLWLPPLVFSLAIGLYSLLYTGVTSFMSGMPGILEPQPVSMLHVLFGLLFIVGFFVMKLGLYLKFPSIYVWLLNLTQPVHTTIISSKSIQK